MKLLLYYAGEDARLAVRMKALCNLMRLASQVPHAWTQAMIQVSGREQAKGGWGTGWWGHRKRMGINKRKSEERQFTVNKVLLFFLSV